MEAIQNLPIVGVVKSHYTFQSIKKDIIDRLLHIDDDDAEDDPIDEVVA
jgi:hypothetical protein